MNCVSHRFHQESLPQTIPATSQFQNRGTSQCLLAWRFWRPNSLSMLNMAPDLPRLSTSTLTARSSALTTHASLSQGFVESDIIAIKLSTGQRLSRKMCRLLCSWWFALQELLTHLVKTMVLLMRFKRAAMQHTAVAKRLPTLIAALRTLGFVDIQHGPCQDWQTFIHHEQKIRLAAWAFCADCLATLSCNKPPGFSILEMRGELPCDSKVWDADATAFPRLRECSRQAKPRSLAELMSLCSNDGWREPSINLKLPLFHLHVMLCGKSSSSCLQPVVLTTI